MKKVVVRTVDAWKFNTTNILPYVGKVVFGENGEFEVNEDQAEKIVELPGFELAEVTEDEDDEDEDKTSTEDEEHVEEEGIEEEQTDLDEMRAQLAEKTLAELKEVAQDMGLESKEYRSLKKDELIDYLIDQTFNIEE